MQRRTNANGPLLNVFLFFSVQFPYCVIIVFVNVLSAKKKEISAFCRVDVAVRYGNVKALLFDIQLFWSLLVRRKCIQK